MTKHISPLFKSDNRIAAGFLNIYLNENGDQFKGSIFFVDRASAVTAPSVTKPLYRVRIKPYRNVVPWGNHTSVYLQKQIHALGQKQITLEEFNRDIDKNFRDGLTDRRKEFITAIKELARKVSETNWS